MKTFDLTVDFNGIVLFDPDRLETFFGGRIDPGTDLWTRFTTTDDGDAVLSQGIVVPILGLNDGTYDVIVRHEAEASPVSDPVIVENGVFPLQVDRRAVLCDLAVFLDWERDVGWHDAAVDPASYGVTVCGFRAIEDGRVVRCGFEFVLARAEALPDLTASLETDMQVLTLDRPQ